MSKKNVGYVAYASSFTSVEEASRRPDAKRVIWHRGAHALEADMEEWVAWQEETIECFSREQLIVNCNPRGEDARKAPPSKKSKLTDEQRDIHSHGHGHSDMHSHGHGYVHGLGSMVYWVTSFWSRLA